VRGRLVDAFVDRWSHWLKRTRGGGGWTGSSATGFTSTLSTLAQTVVLLHGFPQDSSSWAAVSQVLDQAGYRTLAPDQPGYSSGARPPRRQDYTDRHLVNDVWALMDAAGVDQAHVVGHDWGGGVAWWAAACRASDFVAGQLSQS
jgi:pimeloyl-ACP methyl ester carboxylesterase